MDFRILGPVEAFAEGRPLPLGGRRQRALLAYLLLHANEVVGGWRLLDELWAEPPKGGLAALQTQVSRLRRIVDDRILTSGSGYTLRVEPGELDLDRFRSLLAEAGLAADPAERSRLLRTADALWHDPPFAGLDVPFVAVEAAALQELRLAALEDRLEADLELGRNGELVSELSSLVARHPLRERLRGHLILALYRNGRQAEALEAFRETRRMLDEELGLEPGTALRELELAILRHDPALAQVERVRASAAAELRPRSRAPALLALALAAASAAGAGFALTSGRPRQALAAQPAVTVRVVRPASPAPAAERSAAAVQRVPRPVPVSRTVPPKRSARLRRPAPDRTTRVVEAAVPARPTRPARVAPTPRPQPKPKPITISDSFDADVIDPSIWHVVTSDPTVGVAEEQGQLVVTVGAGAAPDGAYDQIDAHVGTQCAFPGDFDASVDYTLLEWPAGDGVFVGLNAIFADAAVGRRFDAQSGDRYTGWVEPNDGAVSLPDDAGSLRITRVNGVETTYFRQRGFWQKLAVGVSRGGAVLGLQALVAEADAFGHQEVKVAFDNFTVTATDAICPAGTEPG